MTETREERKARLEAELRTLDTEDREDEITRRADQTSLGDVVHHLVSHSTGYPTQADREVHARAVRREFKLGEYADDAAADEQDT